MEGIAQYPENISYSLGALGYKTLKQVLFDTKSPVLADPMMESTVSTGVVAFAFAVAAARLALLLQKRRMHSREQCVLAEEHAVLGLFEQAEEPMRCVEQEVFEGTVLKNS